MNFLSNHVNAATGTIQGRAVFRNPDRDLVPGLFVRLRIAGNGSSRALLIRDGAVGTDLDKKFVFVVDDDRTIAYRPLTLGPLVDGLRVVRTGLQPGDRVVVNGLQRVQPGIRVAPEMTAMDTSPPSADPAAPAPIPADAGASSRSASPREEPTDEQAQENTP
jgi:RND family efflux transporter MFP subunit